MARKPLGRGLSALLGENTDANQSFSSQDILSSGLTEIDITLISGNPEQPRSRFDEKALSELASSIASNGIVQPILLRRTGDSYQIVAGERRWRAAQIAGLRKVPAVIKKVDDDKILEIALIENIQREELNPIEEANAFRNLIDNIGLTQDELSQRIGKERTLIATALRLLKLPPEIQELIAEGKISAGHGRALLLASDRTVQIRTARAIIEKRLSVRETEKVVKREASEPTQTTDNKQVKEPTDPNIKYAETKLMRSLGTSVKISPGKKEGAGKIEIEYYNSEDLDRIYQILTAEPTHRN